VEAYGIVSQLFFGIAKEANQTAQSKCAGITQYYSLKENIAHGNFYDSVTANLHDGGILIMRPSVGPNNLIFKNCSIHVKLII